MSPDTRGVLSTGLGRDTYCVYTSTRQHEGVATVRIAELHQAL